MLVGQKVPLVFLSKNKRHVFHFHQGLYWTVYSKNSLVSSATFCYFSGNFIISSSQNFYFFWAKNSLVPGALYSLPGKKFFSLKGFCKDQNEWKSEDVMSGEYCWWVRTFQPSCNGFSLVIKHAVLLILTEDCAFSAD